MRIPAAAALALALVLPLQPAGGHGTFEASELELHLLNDEGSDLIESYGGYDITEAFLGFAHDPAAGAGPAGDGFYLRAELYGDRKESAVPAGSAAWSVHFRMEAAGKPLERTLSTTDGATFTSDFDGLLVEAEGRETHVLRAFVAYGRVGLAPGDSLRLLRVESRVDGDLRDVAPGGIPVPGTDGAATYPDPTQVDGRGLLLEEVALRAPDGYVAVRLGGSPGGGPYDYGVTVQSLLQKGGQHVFVQKRGPAAWNHTLEGETSASLAANGTLSFRLLADPAGATEPLVLDLLTDVGGRSELRLEPDGTLHGPHGASFKPAPATAEQTPASGAAALGLLLVALAAARRHQQS